MRSDGFTIGAHSRSHRWLQDLSRADAEEEIVESCRTVRDITGQTSVPFAFPYFGGGLDRAWAGAASAPARFHRAVLRHGRPARRRTLRLVQRVFGERLGHDRTLDAILRRAWGRRPAWRRHG
ncbi:MAG: polysaccharide deacetylase family protein [Aliidongia sp.]